MAPPKTTESSTSEERGMITFNYLGHINIGILIGLSGLAKTPEDMAVLVLASLLPDIDHPQSTFGRYNPFARWGIMKHRGFTHTLLGALALSFPFLFFGGHMFLLVLIGCLGHIFGDWLVGLLPKRESLPLRFW